MKWFANDAISFILSQDIPNTVEDSESAMVSFNDFFIIIVTQCDKVSQ